MSEAPRPRWRVGRRVATALGAALLLIAYATLTGGVALLWSDRGEREHGYVWSPGIPAVTEGYAISSDDIHHNSGGVQRLIDVIASEVRLEVTPTDPTDVMFVGVARSADAGDYLRGVAHRQVGDIAQAGEAWGWLGPGVTTERPGGPPDVHPKDAGIWLAQSSGVGTRTLTWSRPDGNWVVVVLQADAGRGVSVTVRTGAAAPDLGWIAGGMVVFGLAALVGAVALVRRAGQHGRHPAPRSAVSPSAGPDGSRPIDDVPVLTGR